MAAPQATQQAGTRGAAKARPTMKSAMASAYKKRHPDMTEEEVEALIDEEVEVVGGEETFESFMAQVAASAETLSSLAPEAQARVMDYQLASARSAANKGKGDAEDALDDDMLKFTKRIIALRAIAGGDGDSKADEKLMEQLDKMNGEIKEMRQEKQAAELQAFEDKFDAKLDGITDLLAAGKGESKASPIEETVRTYTEQTESMNKFRAIFGMPPLDAKPPETAKELTATEMKEKLEKEGFEVKGPMGAREMQEWVKQQVAEVEKKTREATRKEMKADEKRNAMIMDLASSFLENALPVIGSTGAKKGLAVMGAALKTAGALATTE